ncbi:hypothetical protein DD565_00195 [Vibrio cholerae]|uniref:glycosyltransferase n=1 Tax=Vibrio cholerae TaxID=666 RepID=UPI000D5E4566|nr:glycosyltransferase [Vibrio cholerae]PVX21204.1 hypothetical protein DD565_00195 [Vibrio cholerae]
MKIVNYSLSVIIPAYNAEKTISSTISSVLDNLDSQDVEVVVVDDGSTDRTGEIVNKFFSGRVKYIYQENQGVSSARNKGISCSSGFFISFLDSDDCYNNDFSLFLSYAKEKSELFDFFSAGYNINGKIRRRLSFKSDFIDFLKEQYFCTNSIIIKKSIMQDNLFRVGYHFGEDVDVWLRILKKYNCIHFNDLIVSHYNFIPKLHDSRNHPFVKETMLELNLTDEELFYVNSRFEHRRKLIISIKRDCSLKELLGYKSIFCLVGYLIGEKGYGKLWSLKNMIRK